MTSENILKFKQYIYNKMKSENQVYSAYKLSSEYIRHYGFDHTKEEIFDFFVVDNRFLRINETQMLLREIVDKLIGEYFYSKDTKYIVDCIKQKYFISNIDEDVIAEIVNRYIKDNRIVLEYGLSYYEIRNKGDFDNVIIREGKISYSALERVSDYLEIGVPELMMELEEKNIFMNDNVDMSYKIYTGKDKTGDLVDFFLYRETKKSGLSNMYDTKSPSNNRINKQEDENILMLDLYPNELLASLMVLINYRDSSIIDNNYFSLHHIESLKKIGIVNSNSNNSKYSLTALGKALIDKFNISIKKNVHYKVFSLLERYYTTLELSKSIEIKVIDKQQAIWDDISDILISIYNSNYFSKTFINLMKLSNKNKGTSMKDIFEIAIKNDKYKELSEILIGNKASNGIKPTLLGKDVCFRCNDKACCLDNGIKMKQQRLLYYRNEYADKFITEVKKNNIEIKLTQQDPLLMKFIVPYTLCVVNKKMMIKLNIIEKSDILYKNSGQYCPAKDKWVVNNGLLV